MMAAELVFGEHFSFQSPSTRWGTLLTGEVASLRVRGLPGFTRNVSHQVTGWKEDQPFSSTCHLWLVTLILMNALLSIMHLFSSYNYAS